MISVFQAEKMPIKLVKELWDLVLQSRFANNKQNLNVLLMGLSDWAESAKSSLGAKSKEQPIVLTSQIDIQPAKSHEFSDVESFIQDKRKKFAQRIKERSHKTFEAKPIYKKWWMATLLSLFFLVVFIGMLGWQYSEKVSAMRSYVTDYISPQEQTVVPSDVSESELVQQLFSTQTAQVASQFDRTTLVSENIPNLTKVGIKELLVTDWNSAIIKLNEQSNKVLLQSYNIDEKLNTQTNRSLVPKQPAIVEDIEAQTDTVNDYQIEDKFKVNITPISSQKGERLANTEQIQTTAFLKPEPGMLLALPNKHFVIQIAAMANIIILQDYVREQQLSQQLWLYKTQRYNVDWFVLLKNQHFSSIEAARVEIINLADAVLKNTPFVKSIEQVKQEISVSEP